MKQLRIRGAPPGSLDSWPWVSCSRLLHGARGRPPSRKWRSSSARRAGPQKPISSRAVPALSHHGPLE